MKNLTSALLLLICFTASSQTPCQNGMAGIYPCNQITLLSHLSPEDLQSDYIDGSALNDIWGWTDSQNGKEYAIVGLVDGVSFVDVSDPVNPIFLGKLPEKLASSSGSSSANLRVMHGKSYWRDIKTFKNHAFIVSDLNSEHSGVQVFDLTKLRNHDGGDWIEYTEDASYDYFHRAHNIAINEETGYAYVVGAISGTEMCNGGLHIIDINDPKNPKFESCFSDDGYTHDVQCVIYQGPDPDYTGMEICFASNEDTFTIVDVDNKSDMNMISRTSYDNYSYTHQGWLSEDHKFFLMNDEQDEEAFGHNPRTLIWNIEDLDSPVLIGDYYNNAVSIDHNLYTHNGLVFESNYSSGLRVLEMSRIEEGMLREVAFFDTYPEDDLIDFYGNWSNYPYFESGTIIASDMNNGLFVLKLNMGVDIISTHPENQTGCGMGGINFSVEAEEAEGTTFRWQRFAGQKYIYIGEGSVSLGTQTPDLTVIPSSLTKGNLIRCEITTAYGDVYYTYPATYDYPEGDIVTPNADFSYTVGNSTEVTFTNNSTDASSYLWDFGDGSSSTLTNPTHVFEAGLHEISLIAFNDCAFSRTEIEVNTTTLANDLVASNFFIFPNPTSRFIYFNEPIDYFEIQDLSGRIVMRSKAISKGEPVDLKKLNSGVYLVVLYTADNRNTSRLVIR